MLVCFHGVYSVQSCIIFRGRAGANHKIGLLGCLYNIIYGVVISYLVRLSFYLADSLLSVQITRRYASLVRFLHSYGYVMGFVVD